MQTRQPPSPAVEPKKPTVRRTSSTVITVRSLPLSPGVRSSTRRSGCALPATRRATGLSGRHASDVACLHRVRRRVGMGQHEPRHAVGERRLADAGGSAEQPRMGDAAAAVIRKQRLLGLDVPVEHMGRARMRNLDRRRIAPGSRVQVLE